MKYPNFGGLNWIYTEIWDDYHKKYTFIYESSFTILPHNYTVWLKNWKAFDNIRGVRFDIWPTDVNEILIDLNDSKNPFKFFKIIEKIAFDLHQFGFNVFLYNTFEMGDSKRFKLYRHICERIIKRMNNTLSSVHSNIVDKSSGYSYIFYKNNKKTLQLMR